MASWYWQEKGDRKGPVSSKELVALVAARRIVPTTMIHKEGAGGWVLASNVKGLFDEPSMSGTATSHV